MSETAAPTRRKRRIFLWVFLAVQALFIVWIIWGIAQGGNHSDCHSTQYLSAKDCASAENAGTALGVAAVIMLWVVVDFLLGVGYAIYRLAKRP